MQKLDSLITHWVKRLQSVGIESARLDVQLLVRHVLGLSREDLVREPDRPVTGEASHQIDGFIARREKHEPIAYLIGKREFWGLDFCVGPEVLIPRPDSETLIEAVLGHLKKKGRLSDPLSILDLGTGSGCLLLALLSELPQARGVGCDISDDAVHMARRNAQGLSLENRAEFHVSHWTEAAEGTFDIIISNPPYIESGELSKLMPDVCRYEPAGALDGGADGLDAYRALQPLLTESLSPGGLLALEIGSGQAEDVIKILHIGPDLHHFEVKQDLGKRDRCVIAEKAV